MYYYRKPISSIIAQWVIFFNVLQAAVLAIEHQDSICGILLCSLSPFSAQMSFLPDGTPTSVEGSIFQKYKIISNQLYYRLYLVLIGVLHSFGFYFVQKKSNIYLGLSCWVPLVLNELEPGNEANNFTIRSSSITIATIISSSFADNYFERTTIDSPFLEILQNNTLYRNTLHAAVIICFGVGFQLKDYYDYHKSRQAGLICVH
jgi:hypothetical protein